MRRTLAIALFTAAVAGCGDNSSNPSDPSNSPPLVLDDEITTPEDTSVVVDVLANDSDPEDDVLEIVAARSDGGVVAVVDGAIRVTPEPDFFGDIHVDVDVSDGDAIATSAALVTVTPVNDAPTALAGTVITGHDSAVAISLAGEDVDGDTLSFEVVGDPGHGAVQGTAPDLIYVPAIDFIGEDALSFVVNDGHGATSEPATIAITVIASSSPVAEAQSTTTAEDTALAVVLVAQDADGDALTYAVSAQPVHGTLSGTAPSLIYTPEPNYHGPDTFAFTATDGVLTSVAAQVSIEVTPVNDAPLAVAAAATTAEDTAVSITLAGTDIDGDLLTYAVANAPAHGTVVVTGTSALYVPAPNSNGTDSFTFTASDGLATSAPAVVSLLVTAQPDGPVAIAQSAAGVEDEPLSITLAATDSDGDALTFAVAQPPVHGSVVVTGATAVYMPAPNSNGPDGFTFTASDGSSTSAPAAVSLLIAAQPDAPLAIAQSASGVEDEPLSITLAATDVDGDALTFAVAQAPAHGSVVVTGATAVYTPAPNSNGADTFTFTASDGTSTSAPAAVSLQVAARPDAPVATAQSVNGTEDAPVSITLAGTDADGDALTYAIAATPAHGSVTLAGANAVYTPAANSNGTDTFTFRVSDGTATSAPATVSVQVSPQPDAPVAAAQSANGNEDAPLAITLAAIDVDGDSLTYAVTAAPGHGTLTGTAPNLTYVPAANYHGPDSLAFTASDAGLTSAPATVSIEVASINDPPTAAAVAVTMVEDHAASFTLVGADVDGDALTYSIVAPPASGAVTGTGASRTYTPAKDTNGNDALTYQVSDGQSTASAIVSLTVTPYNDFPVGHDDIFIATPGQANTIPVLDNDEDVDGDAITLYYVGGAYHGDVTKVDNEMVYTPDPGFTGNETLYYEILDPYGWGGNAEVHVGVGHFPTNMEPEFIATTVHENHLGSTFLQDLSDDAQFVAFATAEALVGEDLNGIDDVYVYDRVTGGLELVSISSNGLQGHGASSAPSISGDGRRVAFVSAASDLVPGDTNGVKDVFVHDRETGGTFRVSIGTDGAQGTGDSSVPELSASGTMVAFTSAAAELAPGDTNGVKDVFVRDLAASTTTRVSVSSTGGEGNGASDHAALSGDGHVVAYRSAASNLVAGDANGKVDVFVRDLVAGTTTRVSVSTAGVEANNDSGKPSLSDDGQIIAFVSQATNLATSGTASGWKAFVRNRQASTTKWVDSDANFQSGKAVLSGDGRYLVGHFSVGWGLVYDTVNDWSYEITDAGAHLYLPVISRNGEYIAWLTDGTIAPVPPGTTGTLLFVFPNPL